MVLVPMYVTKIQILNKLSKTNMKNQFLYLSCLVSKRISYYLPLGGCFIYFGILKVLLCLFFSTFNMDTLISKISDHYGSTYS